MFRSSLIHSESLQFNQVVKDLEDKSLIGGLRKRHVNVWCRISKNERKSGSHINTHQRASITEEALNN